jgi:hypothetical protein
MQVSSRSAALAYWQGQYIAIDQNEEVAAVLSRLPAAIQG